MSPLPTRGDSFRSAPPTKEIFTNPDNHRDRPLVTANDALKIILAKLKKGEQGLTQSDLANELDISTKQAQELMQELEEKKIISPYQRGKPRNILITIEPPPQLEKTFIEPVSSPQTIPTPPESSFVPGQTTEFQIGRAHV